MDFQIIDNASLPTSRSKLADLPWAAINESVAFQVPVTPAEGEDLPKAAAKLIDGLRVYGAKIGKTLDPKRSYTVRSVMVDGSLFVRVWRIPARPARPNPSKGKARKKALAAA